MAARRCASCSKFMAAPVGRGRPALKCAKCKPEKVIVLRNCRGCEVTLPAPEGRGRPPVKCVECRASKTLVNA